MSAAGASIVPMTPTELLTFEAKNPGWSSNKEMRIRNELAMTPPRYLVLLERAAGSLEGQAAHPLVAHRVSSRRPSRTRWAGGRLV